MRGCKEFPHLALSPDLIVGPTGKTFSLMGSNGQQSTRRELASTPAAPWDLTLQSRTNGKAADAVDQRTVKNAMCVIDSQGIPRFLIYTSSLYIPRSGSFTQQQIASVVGVNHGIFGGDQVFTLTGDDVTIEGINALEQIWLGMV
jgi:hypothetical protein